MTGITPAGTAVPSAGFFAEPFGSLVNGGLPAAVVTPQPSLDHIFVEPAAEPVAEANVTDGRASDDEAGDEHWPIFSADPSSARQSVLTRLGLESDAGRAVLAPVLFCTLVGLCGTPVGLLTAPLLEEAFRANTGLDLRSVQVVTRHSIQAMPSINLCAMLKHWANNLRMLVSGGSSVDNFLGWAAACNQHYDRECMDDANGLASGLNERAAQRVLAGNGHRSRLFLGLSAGDVQELYERLGFGDSTDAGTNASANGTA
ncbi:hypothetical protein IWW57_003493 [Coemansia sp. S610]|nr:hypothetical protein IWW57_003493 [Coemansia sp. S610]KAJ2408934.1 hypothetical protein GGI10_004771 [Coemansia sp. RSA 2530]KAJ2700745.1 hypothetical protein H4218_001834 [Coemansia sp. IMI 209128]